MKKWKSLFACGLVLLLTGWTMLCIPFNAYAQTWEAGSGKHKHKYRGCRGL